MIPKCEIRVYKKLNEENWSDEYTSYTISSLDLAENIEVSRDMFKFSFFNINSKYSNAFSIDDKVMVYLYYGSSPQEQDLVFDGLITEIDMDLSSEGRIINVTGANRTNELLSSLVLINFTNNSKKVYEVIQEIINQVNNNNQASSTSHPRHIFFDNTTLVQTKRNGSSFSNKNFLINYKTAYGAIQQFSDNEYTDDGQYVFWIDNKNYFHWTYKSILVPSGYNFEEGDNIIRISIQKGTWEVFNCVIVDVGKDCYGNGNHILQINTVSIIKTGSKWKFLDRSTLSPTLINEQWKADKSKWDNDTGSDGLLIRKSNFPNTYPFTMTFNYLDNSYNEASYKWQVSSSSQFNEAIRKRAKYEGKKIGKDFLNRKGEISYKAKLEIPGTLNFEKGLLCNIICPSFNLFLEKLRINEVSHTFNKNGWITSLALQEDID